MKSKCCVLYQGCLVESMQKWRVCKGFYISNPLSLLTSALRPSLSFAFTLFLSQKTKRLRQMVFRREMKFCRSSYLLMWSSETRQKRMLKISSAVQRHQSRNFRASLIHPSRWFCTHGPATIHNLRTGPCSIHQGGIELN